MSEFKGTKGPWVASKSDRSIGPIIKDDDQSYGMILPVAWVEFNGKSGHQEADANLIAAAPELLEACLRARNQLYSAGYDGKEESYNPAEELLYQLERVIGKALGQ